MSIRDKCFIHLTSLISFCFDKPFSVFFIKQKSWYATNLYRVADTSTAHFCRSGTAALYHTIYFIFFSIFKCNQMRAGRAVHSMCHFNLYIHLSSLFFHFPKPSLSHHTCRHSNLCFFRRHFDVLKKDSIPNTVLSKTLPDFFNTPIQSFHLIHFLSIHKQANLPGRVLWNKIDSLYGNRTNLVSPSIIALKQVICRLCYYHR